MRSRDVDGPPTGYMAVDSLFLSATFPVAAPRGETTPTVRTGTGHYSTKSQVAVMPPAETWHPYWPVTNVPSNGVLADTLEYTVDWNWIWGGVLVGYAAVFLPLELIGTRDDRGKNYGTLSATLRRWLGIDPPQPRRWWTRIAFALLLVVFGIHILTDWL